MASQASCLASSMGSSEKEEFPVIVNKIIVSPKVSTCSASAFSLVAQNNSTRRNGSRLAAKRRSWFRMSDVIVSVTILLTISIAFWRGVWQIADYYCEVYAINPWTTFAISNVLLFLLYYYQETFKKYIHPSKINFLAFYIITRFLLLFHAVIVINQWRGLWVALEVLFGFKIFELILTFVVPIVFSILLKVFINFLGTPLLVGIDDVPSIHSCPFRYNTPPEKACQYFWDCFFSSIIVPSLSITSWRSLWSLVDIYIYPDDLLSSAVVSWIIGSFIVIALCAIQPIYYKSVSNMRGFSRLVIMNLVTLFGFVGCVMCWRGCWELFNVLLIFDTKLTSEWITTIFGALGSIILGCVSTLVSRGSVTDGDIPADNSAEWTISYVSLLQDGDSTVPLQEPWILRYFCTSQKMNLNVKGKNKTTSGNSGHLNDLHHAEMMKPLNREIVNNFVRSSQMSKYSEMSPVIHE